jgi:hypothetical protein
LDEVEKEVDDDFEGEEKQDTTATRAASWRDLRTFSISSQQSSFHLLAAAQFLEH